MHDTHALIQSFIVSELHVALLVTLPKKKKLVRAMFGGPRDEGTVCVSSGCY
jgi:hypothetical protein